MGKTLWELTYADLRINVDTHVVMGLNDLLALIRQKEHNDKFRFVPTVSIDDQVKSFMAPLEDWYNLTVKHATDHDLLNPNRFTVSTLVRPPQLYKLPGNRNKMLQTWPTHNELIDRINNEIRSFNQLDLAATGDSQVDGGVMQVDGGVMQVDGGVRQVDGGDMQVDGGAKFVPNLAGLGNRKSSQGLRQHTGVQWREKRADRKLHLGMALQAKALDMCVGYLRDHTPNQPSQYKS